MCFFGVLFKKIVDSDFEVQSAISMRILKLLHIDFSLVCVFLLHREQDGAVSLTEQTSPAVGPEPPGEYSSHCAKDLLVVGFWNFQSVK